MVLCSHCFLEEGELARIFLGQVLASFLSSFYFWGGDLAGKEYFITQLHCFSKSEGYGRVKLYLQVDRVDGLTLLFVEGLYV